MKTIRHLLCSTKIQKPLALSSLLLPALGLTASAATLASWDNWVSGSVDGSDYDYSADATFAGFNATITQVGNDTDRRTNDTWGSTDGTFGNDVSGASTTGNALFVAASYADTLLITISNSSGQAYQIDSFHFDFAPRESGNATDYGFNAFDLTYTSGGLGPDDTLIDSQSGLDYVLVKTTGALSNYPGYDLDLAGDLSDLVLADGESAVFTLTFSGNAGENGVNVSSVLDNLAFEGQVIPEPSSAALIMAGCAGVLLMRRRRA